MANWRMKIDIGDALNPEAELTLPERADLISKAFAESGLYRTYEGGDLLEYVDLLKVVAEEGDADEFDAAMGSIYDWCDWQLVWIESYRGRAENPKGGVS